jgi:hypothetical protein
MVCDMVMMNRLVEMKLVRQSLAVDYLMQDVLQNLDEQIQVEHQTLVAFALVVIFQEFFPLHLV